jgi:hypothetical protein
MRSVRAAAFNLVMTTFRKVSAPNGTDNGGSRTVSIGGHRRYRPPLGGIRMLNSGSSQPTRLQRTPRSVTRGNEEQPATGLRGNLRRRSGSVLREWEAGNGSTPRAVGRLLPVDLQVWPNDVLAVLVSPQDGELIAAQGPARRLHRGG